MLVCFYDPYVFFQYVNTLHTKIHVYHPRRHAKKRRAKAGRCAQPAKVWRAKAAAAAQATTGQSATQTTNDPIASQLCAGQECNGDPNEAMAKEREAGDQRASPTGSLLQSEVPDSALEASGSAPDTDPLSGQSSASPLAASGGSLDACCDRSAPHDGDTGSHAKPPSPATSPAKTPEASPKMDAGPAHKAHEASNTTSEARRPRMRQTRPS
jgi:hypothetical protein